MFLVAKNCIVGRNVTASPIGPAPAWSYCPLNIRRLMDVQDMSTLDAIYNCIRRAITVSGPLQDVQNRSMTWTVMGSSYIHARTHIYTCVRFIQVKCAILKTWPCQEAPVKIKHAKPTKTNRQYTPTNTHVQG